MSNASDDDDEFVILEPHAAELSAPQAAPAGAAAGDALVGADEAPAVEAGRPRAAAARPPAAPQTPQPLVGAQHIGVACLAVLALMCGCSRTPPKPAAVAAPPPIQRAAPPPPAHVAALEAVLASERAARANLESDLHALSVKFGRLVARLNQTAAASAEWEQLARAGARHKDAWRACERKRDRWWRAVKRRLHAHAAHKRAAKVEAQRRADRAQAGANKAARKNGAKQQAQQAKQQAQQAHKPRWRHGSSVAVLPTAKLPKVLAASGTRA